MRQRTRRRPDLQLAAALAVAAPIALVPAAPAAALTADQATEAFDAFVEAYWDPDADYFFTYSDHRVHPEHAHGPQGGLYTDYWWEAQLWEMVMDRYERTGDPEARAMIDDVYDGFRAAYPDPLANDWNDDIGWWALGSTRADELTGDQRYLEAAEDLFAFVSAHEDDTYGGGIWWKNVDVGDGARNQKNVATTAPAGVTAMRLHAATGDPAYRDTAVRLYDWLDDGFHRDGQLRDHVEGDGTYVDWDWTYNQGTYAAAALELYLDTGDTAYLDDATGAVDWAVANLTSSGTFLREGVDDAGGFKAVLARTRRSLVDDAGQVRYEAVLTSNASQAGGERDDDVGRVPGDELVGRLAGGYGGGAARGRPPHGRARGRRVRRGRQLPQPRPARGAARHRTRAGAGPEAGARPAAGARPRPRDRARRGGARRGRDRGRRSRGRRVGAGFGVRRRRRAAGSAREHGRHGRGSDPARLRARGGGRRAGAPERATAPRRLTPGRRAWGGARRAAGCGRGRAGQGSGAGSSRAAVGVSVGDGAAPSVGVMVIVMVTVASLPNFADA